MLTVVVTHTFSAEQVGDWLVTMFEGNDMVDSWCEGIRIERQTDSPDKTPTDKKPWYMCLEDGCTIWVKAEDHSYKGKGTKYKEYQLTCDGLVKAFKALQEKEYGHIVRNLVEDNYDAIDVDCLLQFAIFGEEVYC